VSALSLAVLALGASLAAVNGANDVSKGVATLVGSGVADYKRALRWGTAWTLVGALAGAVFAKAMVSTFGSGMLAPHVHPTLTASACVLVGAMGWVMVATLTGLPVSTTHAIVGSVSGVGLVAYGTHGVRWAAVAQKIAAPLLVTPFVSLLIVWALLARFGPALARADAARVDRLHWLTSGAASFARGMNDAPKIVALVVSALAAGGAAVSTPAVFALISCAMVAGSALGGRKVASVLAEKVTKMDHREGFVANLATATLVSVGATLGLPLSTTHVSAGGIVGAGIVRGALSTRTLRDIALAWVVTLPASALIGALSMWLASR
jgi:PiT family inorganic phosphate transporter